MSRNYRRAFGVLFGMGASVAILGAAADPSLIPTCAKTKAWVEANAGRLPTTLAELARYPMAYRRAIFSAQPLEIKKSIVREHLDSYLAPASPLTESQRRIVIAIRNDLDFYFSGQPGRDSASRLKPYLTLTFGATLGRDVFAQFGPSDSLSIVREPPIQYKASMVPDISAALLRNVAARFRGSNAKTLHPDCTCSTSDGWCGPLDCHYGDPGECQPSDWGCGFGGLYGCNGLCY